MDRMKIWRFRVTDESIAPREFLMLNEMEAQGLIKGFRNKPTTEIPGVEFYPETVTIG